MPQSSRASRHTDERERVSEQESKRNRGAISCAECRRLKLKCDKTVPCSSCTRRGCASICPNGSLTTGQGTRYVVLFNMPSDDIEHLRDSYWQIQIDCIARLSR